MKHTIIYIASLIFNITGGGVDYSHGPYYVLFPAGITRVVFEIPINDDNLLEENEIFYVTIVSSSQSASVTAIQPDEATVTIVDNDGRCFV